MAPCSSCAVVYYAGIMLHAQPVVPEIMGSGDETSIGISNISINACMSESPECDQ